jgi:hypothetical protein
MRAPYFIILCAMAFGLSACKPETDNKNTASTPQKTQSQNEPEDKKDEGIFGGLFSDSEKSSEPTKVDLGEFKILEVNVGTSLDSDNLVTKPKTVFTGKDKIYASVLSNGKHQGLNIKARWTAPDGKLVAETIQTIVPTSATVSTFSISNEQPWPTGAYTLDISLNDQVQRTVSFEVK